MITELHHLIHSLSAIEKKMFILNSKTSEGEKDYIFLYNLILNEKNISINEIRQIFKQKFPNKSFQNNVSYLFRTLLKILVTLRVGQDKWFNEMYGLMVARLCSERSLPNYALNALRTTKEKAKENQNHVLSYYAERMELSLLSDLDFPALDESALVKIQMNLNESINKIKHIQQQVSLFELLRLRILNQNKIAEKISQKKIQDLILSEITLISGKNKDIFLSQKLHLMFQSFFFTHTSDHNSALHVFKKLNELFEDNENLRNFPPYDYLSVLDGILNTLRTIGQYEEMEFYLQKLTTLADNSYPEHFRNEVHKSVSCYTLHSLLGQNNVDQALVFIQSANLVITRPINTLKESEFIVLATCLHAYREDWRTVRKLSSSFLIRRHSQSMERVGRLLSIIARYELRDISALDYEIRSYKRSYNKTPYLFGIEKIIFSLISYDIAKRGNAFKNKFKSKLLFDSNVGEFLDSEEHDSLLKYYDFKNWAMKQLS